jgi:hypothetical protein
MIDQYIMNKIIDARKEGYEAALKEVGEWLEKQPDLPVGRTLTRILVLDEGFYKDIDLLLQGKMPDKEAR